MISCGLTWATWAPLKKGKNYIHFANKSLFQKHLLVPLLQLVGNRHAGVNLPMDEIVQLLAEVLQLHSTDKKVLLKRSKKVNSITHTFPADEAALRES